MVTATDPLYVELSDFSWQKLGIQGFTLEFDRCALRWEKIRAQLKELMSDQGSTACGDGGAQVEVDTNKEWRKVIELAHLSGLFQNSLAVRLESLEWWADVGARVKELPELDSKRTLFCDDEKVGIIFV